MKCDHCRDREAVWMYPDGEATFFACDPCRNVTDKVNRLTPVDEHDPDRWNKIPN